MISPQTVAILILNRNQAEYTRDCLVSLQQIDYPSYRILVIDNGSTDDSLRRVAQQFPTVDFLWLKENLGVAGGRNAGLREALRKEPAYVFFLDNDTLVAPDSLTRLVNRMNTHAKIGAVQPKIYFASPPDRICTFGGKFYRRISHYRHPESGHCDSVRTQVPTEIDIVSGCAGLMRAIVFQEIGLLDETYSPYCHEDVDWSLRMRNAGYCLMVEPAAVIWHRISSAPIADAAKLRELAKAHILFLRFHTRFFDLPLSIVWVSFHMVRRYLFPVIGRHNQEAVKAILHGIWLGLRQQRRPIEKPSGISGISLSPTPPAAVSDRSKKKILLGGVLGPLDAGPTRVYETLLKSRFAEYFQVRFLDLQFARNVGDFERLRPGKFVRLLRSLFLMMYHLLRNRYATVCIPLSTNRNAFLKDSLFLWLGVLMGLPVIILEHGTNIPALYEKAGPMLRWFMRTTLQQATRCIVLAECLKFNFEPFLPADRIVSVYLGIDSVRQKQPISNNCSGLESDRKCTLVFLSTLVKAKGILVLLEALTELLTERQDISCVLAGGWGWDVEQVRPKVDHFLAQEYARDSVSLRGLVKGDEKLRVFQEGDIFVLPTLADASPHVILEAMRAGLPIVATDVGAIPELVKDGVNGLICLKDDPQDLAQKICYLVDRPDLRQAMSRNNLDRFEDFFTADKFALRMIEVFESVFAEARKEIKSVDPVEI
jgi:GT2 family glycosyltransferase/glycosyltransferase involved in cell wall biosynthesis